MANNELTLISPREFKERFASSVGIGSIRELFHREDFPSIQLGNKYFTTMQAATTWLSTMGKEL